MQFLNNLPNMKYIMKIFLYKPENMFEILLKNLYYIEFKGRYI